MSLVSLSRIPALLVMATALAGCQETTRTPLYDTKSGAAILTPGSYEFALFGDKKWDVKDTLKIERAGDGRYVTTTKNFKHPVNFTFHKAGGDVVVGQFELVSEKDGLVYYYFAVRPDGAYVNLYSINCGSIFEADLTDRIPKAMIVTNGDSKECKVRTAVEMNLLAQVTLENLRPGTRLRLVSTSP